MVNSCKQYLEMVTDLQTTLPILKIYIINRFCMTRFTMVFKLILITFQTNFKKEEGGSYCYNLCVIICLQL